MPLCPLDRCCCPCKGGQSNNMDFHPRICKRLFGESGSGYWPAIVVIPFNDGRLLWSGLSASLYAPDSLGNAEIASFWRLLLRQEVLRTIV